MKNRIIFIAAFLLLSGGIFSQPTPPQQKQEDVEAQRIAFITTRLNLTPEEAQKFWPVYNKYRGELEVIRKSRATELMNAKVNFSDYTDEQINQLIENEFTYRQKELDLQKKYNDEYKKVLPVKKVAMLYRAEQLFKVKLINDVKNKPVPEGQPHPPKN